MSELIQYSRVTGFDGQLGVISVGVERVPVKLLQNPNGGLSILAQKRPDFPCDCFADLTCSDGQSFSGQIKYIEQTAVGFQIGFQRRETIDTSHVDLRDSFPSRLKRILRFFPIR